jgi:uncharacterized membrane protein
MKNNLEEMHVNKRIARVAGLWYLLLGITSGFSWMYLTRIFVAGNATLTVSNILASEPQYLMAIISNIIGQISFIFLVLALYRLLKHVDETQSKLMLTLVVVSVPIMFTNIFFQTGVLVVLRGADYLKVFSVDQLSSLAMMFINLNITGVHIVGIFWGLWLFPLSYLVYKSKYFPKILAVLLIISGVCYLTGNLTSLIIPEVYVVIEKFLSLPEAIGESAMILWLLIKGITISENNI